MCGNLFGGSKSSPKVEKVAPAPTAITPTDTGSQADRLAADAEKQRRKRGYASTRSAADREVLTDTAQGGARQTLG